MKTLFIPLIKKEKNLNFNLKALPSDLAIAYTIQYKKTAQKLAKKLKLKNKKIKKPKQVLGCSKLNIKEKNILLVTDGKFHALNLILQGYNVFIFSGGKIEKINEKEIQDLKKTRKAALLKFYNAKHENKIGILVSVKPGQYNLKQALALRKKYKATIFLADNINTAEFENFPIKSYINTACPTLIYDSTFIVNPEEIF